jgi:hypothetical protein
MKPNSVMDEGGHARRRVPWIHFEDLATIASLWPAAEGRGATREI